MGFFSDVMHPRRILHLYELRKLLDVQAKILAQGGTVPLWMQAKIAELEAE